MGTTVRPLGVPASQSTRASSAKERSWGTSAARQPAAVAMATASSILGSALSAASTRINPTTRPKNAPKAIPYLCSVPCRFAVLGTLTMATEPAAMAAVSGVLLATARARASAPATARLAVGALKSRSSSEVPFSTVTVRLCSTALVDMFSVLAAAERIDWSLGIRAE